ncbi:MAG: tail fiber protein [Bacteroidia bacterium]|nr:tail fiber protein [Bacteroidia bacterium]
MDGYISEVRMFGGNFAPLNWAFCSGQLLPISEYDALFAIIGTTYGGDGQTTFALPDLRGKDAVGAGAGPGLSNIALGQQVGSNSMSLITANLPAHTHTATYQLWASNQPATTTNPDNAVHALEGGPNSYDVNNISNVVSMRADSLQIAGNVTGITGAGQPLDLGQPSLGLNFIICLNGIFPSQP